MNAMPMNALGTFDPRDAMERWNQQTQNAQQNALMPSGGDAISFLPQPVQISGPMMPAMPQPQAMPMMPGSNAYDGGDYAGGAASAPAPAPAPAAPAKQSPNHSYDHGLGFGSGLAGRGPVSTTRAGRVAAAQKAGTFGGIQDAYNAANPTRWMDDSGQIGQRPKSVPFGGFRANGGPVQPGRAYVVGERGPELMVPQVPGTIVPNAATRPMPVNPLDQHVGRINAREDQSLAESQKFWNESTKFWGDRNQQSKQDVLQAQETRNRFKPGSAEWQAANDSVNRSVADYESQFRSQQNAAQLAAEDGARIGTGEGWQRLQRADAYSQQNAEAVMAEMRAKRGSQPPANVTPASSSTPAAAPPTGGPGMLVAGPGGSVVWQRGTGPGTTLPPQTTPAAPAQSASMPMMGPANNSRIAQSPSNRPYAELAGGTGSLANRGTRPIGRSANDPGRMNEMAMRRLRSQGDIVGAARLANSNAWLDARLGGPAMRAPQPMPMMMPPQPSANRAPMPMPGTPGQSLPAPEMTMPDAGATADAAAPAAPPPMDAPPMSFEQAFNQSPLAGAGLPPMNQAMPPMQVPAGTFAQMPGLNQGAFKGAYVEAPPLVGSAPIPGTDQMQPFVMGQPKGAPVNRTQPPKPAEPTKVPDGIQYEKDALGNITGGKYPAWDEARQTWVIRSIDLDGNGVVSPQERAAANAGSGAAGQQPGWMGWLQSQK